MSDSIERTATGRRAPLALDTETFRRLGYQLVDDLAERLARVPEGRVTPGERPTVVRTAIDAGRPLPEDGADPAVLLSTATRLLFEHSLFNGHPRFLGYITSSPAPIGMLADLLAAAVNPNVGAWALAPMATEMEAQAVRWMAEFIGFPTTCGGLMVSGGNMANMVAFNAARAAAATGVRELGVDPARERLRVYASRETHTWIQKAADLSGLGTDAVRWIDVDSEQRMDVGALARQIDADRAEGLTPLLAVGTAGTVSTGAVDPLAEIGTLCRRQGIWFHVDGAYGGFAAGLSNASRDLRALGEADSVAVDPHKWLYAPLEVGCCLVRDAGRLRAAFSFHPPYYHFDETVTNYFDFGPQNSRGFRALKVWLQLQHVGARGYRQMIADDMSLAVALAGAVRRHASFELITQHLSITTFRYVPPDLRGRTHEDAVATYLNRLNQQVLDASQQAGAVFVSNAVVAGRFVLRACVVNFHTSTADVLAVPDLLEPIARALDGANRPPVLRAEASAGPAAV